MEWSSVMLAMFFIETQVYLLRIMQNDVRCSINRT
jgi:hypothetical protein